MFKLDLEKAEEPEIKIANIHWITEKGRGTRDQNCQHPLDHRKSKSKRIPEKNICFIDYAKAFDCVDHNKLENS